MLYLQWLTVKATGDRVSVADFHAAKPQWVGDVEKWIEDRGWSYTPGYWLPLVAAFGIEAMRKIR